MATSVDLDNDLVAETQRLGNHRSKKATIENALKEYVERRKQLEIVQLFGQIDYDEARGYQILTTDPDFLHFSPHIGIELIQP